MLDAATGSSVWLRHDGVLAHDVPGHPESPDRVRRLEAVLAQASWLGLHVRAATPASAEQVLAVHSEGHLGRLEALDRLGGGVLDADTRMVPGSLTAGLLAAGAAIGAVDAVLAGARSAWAGARPPGHHAESSRAMGFCLLNSVAIAARHAQRAHGVGRVMIVDWDVHHGNGTSEIFWCSDDVLFVSLHQHPLYPGTGAVSETGAGPGRGLTVNLPVAAGSGDALWCSLVEHVVVALGMDWRPDLVLVSAGFDAHADDPLGGCMVTEAGFATMAGSVRRLADALQVPVAAVLEGGYDVDALARSVAAVVPVLAGPTPEPPADLPVHPLASAALRRLAGP